MKFRLTDETKTTASGVVLHRICALRDIKRWKVHKGDLGGWVEKKANLGQGEDAWISGNAVVCGNAAVYGDTLVYGDAVVSGDAMVCGDARVYGNAMVYGDAEVYGNARVYGNAMVDGDAEVCGDANVYGDAVVYGNAVVSGNATVGGIATVRGDAVLCGDAVVRSSADYAVFKNFWSSGRWFTYTRSNKMWKVGCFYGTGEELIKKAYAASNKRGRCYEAIVRAVEAIESATAKRGGAE